MLQTHVGQLTCMNSSFSLRPLQIGAVYLALHFASQAALPCGAGLESGFPWFAAGLALALFLLEGIGYAPVVAAALVTSSLLSTAASGMLLGVLWPLIVTGILAATAKGLRSLLGTSLQITRTRELALAVSLLFGAALLSSFVGALFLFTPTTETVTGGAFPSMLRLWVSHFTGLFAFGLPLALFASRIFNTVKDPRTEIKPLPLIEISLQIALLVLCVVLTFISPSLWVSNLSCLAPLVWIAIRFGLPGVAPALVVLLAGKWSLAAYASLPFFDSTSVAGQDILISAISLILGVAISARERAQNTAQSRYRAMKRVLSGAQMGFWEWDGGQRMTLDEQWFAMMGFERDGLDGTDASWRRQIHPDDLSHVLWMRDAHWKGHAPSFDAEYRLRSRDGSYRWVLDRGTIVERGGDGTPSLMAGVCLDITERKQGELQLQRIVQIVDSAADYIGAADVNGNMIYANQALMRQCNDADLSAVRRRHLSEYFPEVIARKILLEGLPAAISQGYWWVETLLSGSLGHEVQVSLKIVVHRAPGGSPQYFSLIARDVSRPLQALVEQKHALVEKQKTRKYESLGVLAGGVAHDINNLLTAMLGNSTLARTKLPADSPTQAYFEQGEQAALRAAELCQLLHTYSGKGESLLVPSELNHCIRSFDDSLASLCGAKNTLVLELDSHALPALLDETLVKHAIMALVRNAAEAYAPQEGRIVLRTGSEHINSDTFVCPSWAPEIDTGDYAFVEVSDQGAGMDDEVKSHLFEPFFSSKPGQAGLGLTRAIAAARAHQGLIIVESERGKGCKVRLYLPLGKIGDAVLRSLDTVPSNWRGAGAVLVVDDEEAVRTVSTYMLESLGFAPLVAASGPEGLRIFKQHPGLKAVILDLSMPIMDGETTYAEIRRLDAEVPIIIMSGFAEREIELRFKNKDLVGFMHKPFTLDALRSLLYKALVPRN
jgi:PAS domain S-box-containing protein